MLELIDALPDPLVFAVELVVVLALLVIVAKQVVIPIYSWLEGYFDRHENQEKLHQFAEHLEDDVAGEARLWTTLREIAMQFEPNDGHSLYDVVGRLERSTEELHNGQHRMDKELKGIADEQAAIRKLIEIHVADRRNGGRRKSDPPA